ncbi:MAG: FkbM family methyltransferase [Chloroflexi bacterium]|nr:FkbM family methyltransferase [Chloroflexota bacterium]
MNAIRLLRSNDVKLIYDRIRYVIVRMFFRPRTVIYAHTHHGFVLQIEDPETLSWYGPYDYEFVTRPIIEFDWMLQHTAPDDVVLDIGGHQGLWSMIFATSASEGEVHMFETSPINSDAARQNMILNSISNVTINNVAMSDKVGEITVVDSSGGVVAAGAIGNELTVPADTGDKYCRTNQIKPTLVKIDVEGWEVPVLKGMAGVLATCPKIILELSTFSAPDDPVGYVRSVLGEIDLSKYEISVQLEVNLPMSPFYDSIESLVDLLAKYPNSHLYLLPKNE